jgi:glycosyltransferase involved in cell wall biosynthesis
MSTSLTIFVPHCSDLLTDHLPHGDGLIAHGFITNLARRGHRLHVTAQRVELREPVHPNISIYPIGTKTENGVRARLEYMLKVRRLFHKLRKDFRFDLIHQLNPVFAGMSLALTGSGLPLVLGTYVARWPADPDSLTSAETLRGRLSSFVRDRICALQQRQADSLLLTTPAAFNRIPNPRAVREKAYFLPHGVDMKTFSPLSLSERSALSSSSHRDPSILFFANIVARKGIFTLLEAFPQIVREFPDVTLRIAGDGPELPEVKRRAEPLACAPQIEFLGRQERRQAPGLYQNCSIYCLPSNGEPYATTVIEAMSCGKPVVVTESGGFPHVVGPRGGKRVPVGDPAALAQGLIYLLRNPSECEAMGIYNRRLVESSMSWPLVAQQLEDIYLQTLERKVSVRGVWREALILGPSADSPAQERVPMNLMGDLRER